MGSHSESIYVSDREEEMYLQGYEMGRYVAQREIGLQKENERLKARIAKLEKFVVDSVIDSK